MKWPSSWKNLVSLRRFSGVERKVLSISIPAKIWKKIIIRSELGRFSYNTALNRRHYYHMTYTYNGQNQGIHKINQNE